MMAQAVAVHDLLDRAAAARPECAALVTTAGEVSYGQLAAQSRAMAVELARAGVGPGDRVVLLSPNSARLVTAIYAVSRLGAVFVVLSASMKPYHLAHVLRDCEPAMVMTTAELAGLVARTGVDVAIRDIDAPVETGGAADPGVRPPARVASLIYTSGSTSMPKAVICPPDSMLFAAQAIGGRLGLLPGDTIGCFLPLAFDYGLYQLLLAAQVGCRVALGAMSDIGPGLLGRLREWHITVLPVVPTMASALLSLLERSPGAGVPVRLITNTGAHLGPGDVARLRALISGCEIALMFGLTECKRVSILRPAEIDDRPGSVGRPLDGTSCQIMRPDASAASPGEVGELVVRGPHVMAGYWRAPDISAERFRSGALWTGDLCSMDRDGYLYFHGRKDDVFKHKGFRVSAIEIEAAALDIPDVNGAVLVHAPDAEPVLIAQTTLKPVEVLAALRVRLDDHKVPSRAVTVVESLPTMANGKIDRTRARELVQS
jgi:acyl-CoA synthetase (AMP-forming)/AMP-acid ligase II